IRRANSSGEKRTETGTTEAACLSRPGKWGEMAVVAFTSHVQIEAEPVQMELGRTRQRQAPICRMRRIVDVEGLSTAVARRYALDLERQHVGDTDRALQPLG